MSTVFQDTFTGSAGTAVTSHTPTIGSSWSLGTGATSPIISNANRSRTAADGNPDFVLANPVTPLSVHDLTTSLEFTYVGTAADTGKKVHLFSHADAAGNGYEFTFDAGVLTGKRNGVSFGSFPSQAISVGESYRMSIKTTTSGPNVTLDFYFQRLTDSFYLPFGGTYQSGAITCMGEGTATDASPLGIGKCGYKQYDLAGQSVGLHVDNFLIDQVGGLPAAESFGFTGPTVAAVGAPSSNFSLTPNGIVASATATPSDGGQGGTFTPTSITWSSSSAAQTFTYTPSTVGTKTLAVTITSGSPATVIPATLDVVCSSLSYIAFIGDSNFWNPSGSATESIPALVLASLGATWTGENRGVSGYTIANVDSDLTNWTGHYNASRPHNLAIVMIGTNGVGSLGASASYTALQGYITDLRAAQSGWKIILVTIPPLGSSPTNRANFNALIKANGVADGASYVIDTTGDSDLENDSNFCDGLHYTELGRNRLAVHIAAGIATYIDSLTTTTTATQRAAPRSRPCKRLRS